MGLTHCQPQQRFLYQANVHWLVAMAPRWIRLLQLSEDGAVEHPLCTPMSTNGGPIPLLTSPRRNAVLSSAVLGLELVHSQSLRCSGQERITHCLQLIVYPLFPFPSTSSLPVIRKGQESPRDKADRLRTLKPLRRPVLRRYYLVLPFHTQDISSHRHEHVSRPDCPRYLSSPSTLHGTLETLPHTPSEPKPR